ncbi:unnamed protein product [Heterobilharzia americana]|nr:unnamed protein product [Heterobilharzia americana]
MGRLKVERSIVQYYLDRLNSLSSIKDFEEKHMFVLNTFLAFQKDGWTVALSPKICYCLEELITHANVECIIVLLKTMSKNWNGVINSKFAYHVLHKALLKCQAMEYHTDELILDYVQSFCAHMKENLSIYIEQQHATHTCRIYPQILAGVLLEKDQISNTYKSAIQLVTPYDENHVVTLTDLCKKFLFTKALKDYVKNENLCPFIQVLLLVASARLSDKFIEKFKKIMKYSGLFSSNTQGGDLDERYLSAYTHPVVTYFAELMVEVMPGAYFADFLNDYILLKCSKSSDGVDSISLADLFMSHSTASRVLRAVIRRLTKPIDIQNFLRVIQSCKDNNYGLCGALSNGQYNVLTELADLCIRHPSEEFQRTFLRVLPKVFGFSEKHIPSSGREDLFIRCLIGMTSVGALNDYLQKNSIKQETVQGEENDNDTTSEEDLINQSHYQDVCLFRLY